MKDLLTNLMGRFIKKDVLNEAATYKKLAALEPYHKKNQLNLKHVELGFAAWQTLKAATDKKSVSELGVLAFKTECVKLLSALTSKLIDRCPLKYPLVQYLSSLNPKKLISSGTDATDKFEKILQILLNGGWRSAEECDQLLSLYKTFSVEMKQEHAAEFNDFTPDSERLDVFLGKYMQDDKFIKLWAVFKLLLTISHGQASVERGYSVNKDLLIENMQEKTIVAMRTVYDSVSAMNVHFTDMQLTPKLKQHVKSARMRYNQYLEDTKKAREDEQKDKKRNTVTESIHETEKKKKKVECSMEVLCKEADELAKEAEKKHDFTLLTKSNAFRSKVSEKAEELSKLENELKVLKTKLFP